MAQDKAGVSVGAGHPYIPFWRDTPFTPDENELLTLLYNAHTQAAQRNNASSAAFRNSFEASGDYTKAVTGALSTLGWPHGPIERAWHVLRNEHDGDELDSQRVGGKLPGWGNGLIRGKPDPCFAQVAERLERFPVPYSLYGPSVTIDRITQTLHASGKHIYPNAACYTAACAIIIGLPAELSPYLFVAARLPAWGKMVVRR